MEINEQMLHDWKVELLGQKFEGAYLTRSQAFAVTELVKIVSVGAAAAAAVRTQQESAAEQPLAEEPEHEERDYASWKNAELSEELELRGLPSWGTKRVMVERLEADDA